MDRRSFLKISAVGAAALSAAPQAFASSLGKKDTPPAEGYLREPSRDIPVVASFDVLVAGGGPAGVAAAICAAREGAMPFWAAFGRAAWCFRSFPPMVWIRTAPGPAAWAVFSLN